MLSGLKVKINFLKLKFALFIKKESFALAGRDFFFVPKSAKYLFREIFIKNTYFFRSQTESPLIFDCGANVGMASVFFKDLYPRSRVFAFEANTETFELLKKNLSEYEQISIHQKALVNFEGEVKFYHSKSDVADLGMSINQRYFQDFEVVPAARLSNFIHEKVDLVKLDIEGAEGLVLSDLIETEKINLIQQMIIEHHHHNPAEPNTIGRFIHQLELNGFSCHLTTEKEEPFSEPRSQTCIIYAFRITK